MNRVDEWWGYPRNGRGVGIRNLCAIVGLDGLVLPLVNRLAGQLHPTVAVSTPFGRGQVGNDERITQRVLVGLASNPNIGAALVVAADQLEADSVAHELSRRCVPTATVTLDEAMEDGLVAFHRGMNRASDLITAMTQQRREPVPLSALAIGIECGHSDATSGLAANPVVGKLVDRFVPKGGSVVVGETYEWLGGEDVLAARVRDAKDAERIVRVVQRSFQRMKTGGRQWSNPGTENQKGGLTTIEEKSLGAIAKSGTGPIDGVLGYGEEFPGPGLFLMDTPFFTPESLTGFAASGVALTIFTTGPGNSFSHPISPTVKVTANPHTALRLKNQIDVDVSFILAPPWDFERAVLTLQETILQVASGQCTRGEIIREEALAISRFQESV